MGEGLGIDAHSRVATEPVVADRRSCVEGFLDLVCSVEQAAVRRRSRPRTRETVGLQLEANTVLVGGAIALLCCDRGSFADAGDRLDVMSVLVCHDVLGGEIAFGRERSLKSCEVVEVEVHQPVSGTVERPDRSVCPSARRVDSAGVEHGVGVLIGPLEGDGILLVPVLRHVIDGTTHHRLDVGIAHRRNAADRSRSRRRRR